MSSKEAIITEAQAWGLPWGLNEDGTYLWIEIRDTRVRVYFSWADTGRVRAAGASRERWATAITGGRTAVIRFIRNEARRLGVDKPAGPSA